MTARRKPRNCEQLASDEGELIECGVDYITVTATRPPETISLLRVAKDNLHSEVEAGNEVRKWRGLGYAGLSAGAASFGTGPQGVIARITGGNAKEAWRTLYQAGANCTRLDVQCTVRFNCEPHERISSDWQRVVKRWSELKRRTEPKLRSGPYGPETIEIGSRQSERFGRVYDKRKESALDHYRNAVRFEVEYKGSLAGLLARRLTASAPALLDTVPHVLAFFRKYQVSFAAPTHVSSLISAPRPESDAARKLRYLHTSVRPLVQFLISSGMTAEIYRALELPGPTDTSREFLPED